MNKSLKSFYDVYRYPDIQKFLDKGKKKSLEVSNNTYFNIYIFRLLKQMKKKSIYKEIMRKSDIII